MTPLATTRDYMFGNRKKLGLELAQSNSDAGNAMAFLRTGNAELRTRPRGEGGQGWSLGKKVAGYDPDWEWRMTRGLAEWYH